MSEQGYCSKNCYRIFRLNKAGNVPYHTRSITVPHRMGGTTWVRERCPGTALPPSKAPHGKVRQ